VIEKQEDMYVFDDEHPTPDNAVSFDAADKIWD